MRYFLWIYFVIVAVMFRSPSVLAQSEINDVHVMPRLVPRRAASLGEGEASIIRKSVELVLVPVTVMDQYHRIITGLKRENFHLFEDKRPKAIEHFWKEDGPVSVGIVLDVSGSMKSKIERARDSVVTLLQASNPQDEFFLVTFAEKPELAQDFTQSADEIQSNLLYATPKGRTSLLDALVLAINNMKKARYQRKALVIISDGGDNSSRYTENEVRSLIKEADILVYSIGVFDIEFQTPEERLGPALLSEISGLTGASAYSLDNPTYLPKITAHIAIELRNQYVLGYKPDTSNSKHNGKWRKIRVSLAVPRGLPAMRVQARSGYYGAAQ